MLNSDDTLMDIPRGKEIIDNCKVPFGVMKEKDGKTLCAVTFVFSQYCSVIFILICIQVT